MTRMRHFGAIAMLAAALLVGCRAGGETKSLEVSASATAPRYPSKAFVAVTRSSTGPPAT